jgi:hypothetical protein
MKSAGLLSLLCLCLAGCGGSNNLFLGEVRARVGTHAVMVTDCYRFSVDPPRRVDSATYEYVPCRDARVTIANETLTVNGQPYGKLKPSDSVLVDHGVVSVHTN